MKAKQFHLSILFAVALSLTAPSLFAQPINPYARTIRNATADPTTCQVSVNNVFFNRTTGLLKMCTAVNTWSSVLRTTGGTLTGPLLLPLGAAGAEALGFGGSTTGLYLAAGTQLVFELAAGPHMALSTAGLHLYDTDYLGWGGTGVLGVVDTKLTRVSAGTVGVTVGTGTAVANVSGTYAKFVSGAGVGNGADLTNDALWTLTAIPANTFTANGDALILTLSFATGATANNKTIGFTVGGTSVITPVFTTNGLPVVLTGTITRVDATHVNVFISGTPSGGVNVAPASSTNLVVSDLTANTLAVVVTGASPTTGAAGDVKLFSGAAQFVK